MTRGDCVRLSALVQDRRASKSHTDEFYRLINSHVLSYLRSRVSPDDRDDIAQEILLTIYRRISTYDLAQKFSPWFYTVCRRKLIDYYRRSSRDASHLVSEPDGFEQIPSSDRADQYVELEELLSSLTPREQDAILVVVGYGLTLEEGAAVNGIAVGNLKVRLHRAKKALIRCLEPESDAHRGVSAAAEMMPRKIKQA